MKANELRIGNLIYWNIPEKVDTIHTVVGIRNDKPQTVPISLGESIENYQPIQLTEEWLIKFGFNKVSDIWEFWKNSGWDLRQHKLENKWWLFYIGQDLDCVRIEYVHQLQNLYFAITGEELTIKTIDQ